MAVVDRDFEPIPRDTDGNIIASEYREQMWYMQQLHSLHFEQINGTLEEHENSIKKLEKESFAAKSVGGILSAVAGIWFLVKRLFN